jgi:penicillin-binding protein 1A
LTTVVWMGRDDATPMRRITGGIAPAELWHNYMRIALKRLPVQAIPAGPAPPAPLPIPVSDPNPPLQSAPAPTAATDPVTALLGSKSD